MIPWIRRGHGNATHGDGVRVWQARGRGGGRLRSCGAIIALALLWASSAHATEPRVLLMRGWFGVFSTGTR